MERPKDTPDDDSDHDSGDEPEFGEHPWDWLDLPGHEQDKAFLAASIADHQRRWRDRVRARRAKATSDSADTSSSTIKRRIARGWLIFFACVVIGLLGTYFALHFNQRVLCSLLATCPARARERRPRFIHGRFLRSQRFLM